jgi:hypothetical protein
MRTLTLIRAATVVSLALLTLPLRAAACAPPWYGIAGLLTQGMPDDQGLIDGKPNPNVLRSGEDILFIVACKDLCGRVVTMKLQDQLEAQIPVTFEPLPPGDYWKVHPVQPLAAGMYTLTYTGTMETRNFSEVQTYVFRVEGEGTVPAPQLTVSLLDQPRYESAGRAFRCAGPADTCGHFQQYFTQNKTYTTIRPVPSEPPTLEQRGSYLYRLVPAFDLAAQQATEWLAYHVFETVSIKQYLGAPESCWIIQTLRVRDGQVTSTETECHSYTADLAPLYPTPFEPCPMADPTAFARAWCEDNRSLCASDQPALAPACTDYADVCAPLLGKRAGTEGACSI